MESEVRCCRCGQSGSRLAKPPIPGRTGEDVQARVCRRCWAEWQQMEVMVINELRLNFMDPSAQKVLDQHLRQFLLLEETEGS